MILKFEDVGRLAVKNYQHHMRKFHGGIHQITIMELIFICLANAHKKGEDKAIYRQLKDFIEDIGVEYDI